LSHQRDSPTPAPPCHRRNTTSAEDNSGRELGPVELGPVELGPVELGPVELGPVELGPVELGHTVLQWLIPRRKTFAPNGLLKVI